MTNNKQKTADEAYEKARATADEAYENEKN